jgi:hypothetical protein
LFEFSGGVIPNSARMVLVGRSYDSDKILYKSLDEKLDNKKMLVLTHNQLTQLINNSKIPENHPIRYIVLDEALEDAVQGGADGIDRIWYGISSRYISRDALDKAHQKTQDVGRHGEAIVYHYLCGIREAGKIEAVEWTSEEINPVSPYDFKIEENGKTVVIDVKATDGEFFRKFHVSMNEIRQMANGGEQYDIYRIYDIRESSAKIRVASNVREFAESVINSLSRLPNGVTPNGFSIKPDILEFKQEEIIEYSDPDI